MKNPEVLAAPAGLYRLVQVDDVWKKLRVVWMVGRYIDGEVVPSYFDIEGDDAGLIWDSTTDTVIDIESSVPMSLAEWIEHQA